MSEPGAIGTARGWSSDLPASQVWQGQGCDRTWSWNLLDNLGGWVSSAPS